jgi:phenylacetate-CoA ligase
VLRAALYEINFSVRGIRPLWRELRDFAALPPELARRRMSDHLLKLVRHFGRRGDGLPEWREAAALPDAEALWRVWPVLPVLTKQTLRERFDPAEMVPRFGLRGRPSATGGSTGEPTHFFHDHRMRLAIEAARLYAWRSMGWTPGMPVVGVWGSERDLGRQQSWRGRVLTWLQNVHIVDGYVLDDTTVERFLHRVAAHPAVCAYGFTSMLEFVAREALRRGDERARGRIRSAWNGGETLSVEQSRLFEAAFGIPILNLYGGRELGALAFQARPELQLQVLRPWVYVEVVDDAGRPAAPGELGRLLVTSTVGRGTPFLRYEIGDLAEYDDAGRDEAGIHALSALHGRQAGVITLFDGRTVNCLYWNHLFKEFPEVEQFQVAWRGERGLQLRLKGRLLAEEREAELRRMTQPVVGATPLEIVWMERLPRTRQGKLLQVVRE